VTCAAFGPAKRCATVGNGGGELIILDVAFGRMRTRYKAHAGTVTAVAVSADGRYALSSATDKTVLLTELHIPDPPLQGP
jgi:WD40 repeat protein